MVDINRLPLQGQGGLMDLLQTLVDPRKPRGVRHPVATVVAIAMLSLCLAGLLHPTQQHHIGQRQAT